jgi:hypothetical protein
VNINNRIKNLGEQLKDRLNPELVDYALGYIDHSEHVIAIETLCDYIGDNDILITEHEYSQIMELVGDLGLDMTNRYLYIAPSK